jgi:hypothetical protein
MTDLIFPAFLVRPRGAQPIHLLLANLGQRRWKRIKTVRPEGETWDTAELQEVYLFDEAQPIGAGRRFVWVREGRKWCKLCSLDGTKVKIPMAVWAIIARRK